MGEDLPFIIIKASRHQVTHTQKTQPSPSLSLSHTLTDQHKRSRPLCRSYSSPATIGGVGDRSWQCQSVFLSLAHKLSPKLSLCERDVKHKARVFFFFVFFLFFSFLGGGKLFSFPPPLLVFFFSFFTCHIFPVRAPGRLLVLGAKGGSGSAREPSGVWPRCTCARLHLALFCHELKAGGLFKTAVCCHLICCESVDLYIRVSVCVRQPVGTDVGGKSVKKKKKNSIWTLPRPSSLSVQLFRLKEKEARVTCFHRSHCVRQEWITYLSSLIFAK